MSRRLSMACIALVALTLTGCSATTTLSSSQGGTSIEIKESTQASLPRSESFATTSFGNYEFRAESPGFESFTGILPLKFNGGYLALDILFFAPAMFFNLREVFPFYEFDLQQRVVKYRNKESDPWQMYMPSAAESTRGRNFFSKD